MTRSGPCSAATSTGRCSPSGSARDARRPGRSRGRAGPAGDTGRRLLPDRAHHRPAGRHRAGRDRVRRPAPRPEPGRRGARRGPDRRDRAAAGRHRPRPARRGRPDQPRRARAPGRGARSDLEHGLWEANASAGGYVSPQSMAFQAIPTALLADAAAVDGYLRRLRGLAGYFDAITARFRQAVADGRLSTAGRRAPGHRPARGAPGQGDHGRRAGRRDRLPRRGRRGRRSAREAARIVADEVRPAMRRLLACLHDELLPGARPDDQVGIRFVPGGAEGYRAAVRRHTTTELTAEQIHQIGLDVLAACAPSGPSWAGGCWAPARCRRSWPGCATTRRCGSPTPRRSWPPSPTRWPAPRRPVTTGSRPTTSRAA